MKNVVNWWDIIAKLRYDKSYWHHLEPAEIMEIVQKIKEGKEKIWGWENFIRIDLRPALRKLNRMRNHLHIIHIHNLNTQRISSC
jgi:hypothetical protein